jgi:alpha-glucosidase
MVWQKDNSNGGFTTAPKPWLPVPSEHLALSVAAEEAEPGSLLHHYRHAIALRHAHPALIRGSSEAMRAEGDILSFLRRDGEEEIFCAFNLGDGAGRVALPDGNWQPIGAELGTTQELTAQTVALQPWQVCLARRN